MISHQARNLVLPWWALLAGAFGLHGLDSGQETSPARFAPFDFQGRFLVAVSDADMLPSAYLDGKLGPPDGVDSLSVIRLDRPGHELHAVETPVYNSVTGPPASVAVTPDGRWAIVIETRGPRPAGKPDAVFGDQPLGREVAVVDLRDPDRPHVVQRLRSFEYPSSVSINAAGTLVAVAYDRHGAGKTTPLAIHRFQDGHLSDPLTPAVPGWTPGGNLTVAEWHPRENLLALLDVDRATVSFVRVEEAGEAINLSAWGNVVPVEKAPFLVRFTPDGRHALVNCAYVPIDGVNVLPGAALHGSVVSIRLAAQTAPDGSPLHELASRAATSCTPEGMCVSPDGRLVVTTNLEQSAWALDDPRQGFFSSLTLLRLDPGSGRLEHLGDFAFDGVLPEAAVFDNSSRFLAVCNFTFFDPRRKGGSIDFWRIAGDAFDPGRTELIKLDFSVPVTRGPQSMTIVR